jgi:hypothetical protein
MVLFGIYIEGLFVDNINLFGVLLLLIHLRIVIGRRLRRSGGSSVVGYFRRVRLSIERIEYGRFLDEMRRLFVDGGLEVGVGFTF